MTSTPQAAARPSGFLERLLRVDPASKPAVYLQIFDGADINNLNYWLELLLSAAIATLGLLLNSPAVVIGAMLISPLMGPIIAAGLSVAVVDVYLFLRSVGQLILSTVAVSLFAGFLVWILGYDAMTDEIAARIRPNFLDLGVALFSGLAGSVLMARSKSREGGGVSTLPGVAVAVALMPPLCTVGIGLGRGFEETVIAGAGLLYLTNLVAIITSAFVVFFVVGLHSKDVRAALERPLAERVDQSSVYRFVKERLHLAPGATPSSHLHWRVLLITAVLVLLGVPLWESFQQLSRELQVRRAVGNARHILAIGKEDILLQRTFVGQKGSPVLVQMTIAGRVEPEAVSEAERAIARDTGLSTELRIRSVLDETEISQLAIAGPEAEHFETLDSVRRDMMRRLEEPIQLLWPEKQALLISYGIRFDQQGAEILVHYTPKEKRPLDQAAQTILLRGLREWLDTPEIELSLVQVERKAK